MTKLADALNKWQQKYGTPARSLSRSIYALCPPPIRFGQDQYRCQKCNMVWDTDEDKPPCTEVQANENVTP